MVENKQIKEILDIVDNVKLLSDKVVDGMDFYQLSSYIQTLNMLETLSEINDVEGD